MDDQSITRRHHHNNREDSFEAMKHLVRSLLNEVQAYGSISERVRDDTDDGYHYIELDLRPEIEGMEFDLSINGDHALIRFVKKVKTPA